MWIAISTGVVCCNPWFSGSVLAGHPNMGGPMRMNPPRGMAMGPQVWSTWKNYLMQDVINMSCAFFWLVLFCCTMLRTSVHSYESVNCFIFLPNQFSNSCSQLFSVYWCICDARDFICKRRGRRTFFAISHVLPTFYLTFCLTELWRYEASS